MLIGKQCWIVVNPDAKIVTAAESSAAEEKRNKASMIIVNAPGDKYFRACGALSEPNPKNTWKKLNSMYSSFSEMANNAVSETLNTKS